MQLFWMFFLHPTWPVLIMCSLSSTLTLFGPFRCLDAVHSPLSLRLYDEMRRVLGLFLFSVNLIYWFHLFPINVNTFLFSYIFSSHSSSHSIIYILRGRSHSVPLLAFSPCSGPLISPWPWLIVNIDRYIFTHYNNLNFLQILTTNNR